MVETVPTAGAKKERVLLSVRGLAVSFAGAGGDKAAVVDASFAVYPRQMVAIVGESGSGKSVTALSVLGLLPSALIRGGQVELAAREGGVRDLLKVSTEELRRVRGGEIAMIFQEPMTSLNPVFSVGEQIVESVELHRGLRGRAAREAALGAMRAARMPDVELRFRQYPHELSGGLRQRAMIAMALAGGPRVLLADEPTTALDVTVQAEVLGLLRELREKQGLGVVFITHDLGLVGEWADVVCVMYAGRVVEYGPVDAFFGQPSHPYTRSLLRCAPRIDRKESRLMTIGELMGGEKLVETVGLGGATKTERAWWIESGAESAKGRLVRVWGQGSNGSNRGGGTDHVVRVEGERGAVAGSLGEEALWGDSAWRRA
jgi:ABC-type dipeptide/oligopeptide/nickel transport system ATPase component